MTGPIDMYVPNLGQHVAAGLSQSGNEATKTSFSNSPADRKLRAAAAEFESLLLSNLWKSMKSSFAASDEDSEDAAHDSLEDWGIESMSMAVGKAGGLGLGKLILKYLEPRVAHSQNGTDPDSPKVSQPPADVSQ